MNSQAAGVASQDAWEAAQRPGRGTREWNLSKAAITTGTFAVHAGGANAGAKAAMRRGSSSRVVVQSGWLRKRKANRWFEKRFVTLTEDTLSYYKGGAPEQGGELKAAIGLLGAMVKKSREVKHCFEVHAPSLLSKKNKEGRMYFVCADDMAVQRWIDKLNKAGLVQQVGRS